jgi:hypothetical protein
MHKLLRPLIASASLLFPLMASAINPGDIAIIGIYTDAPDKTAFVALANLPAGTTINFTDEGWKSSGSFRSGENHISWTAPSGGITAGTVVALDMSDLSNSGDQVIAYTGSSSSPTFIFALNNDGSSWASNATSNNNSALPTGLTNGSNAIALDEKDNAAYTGITSGTASALLAAIANKSNWTGSDGSTPNWPSSFTITSGVTSSSKSSSSVSSLLSSAKSSSIVSSIASSSVASNSSVNSISSSSRSSASSASSIPPVATYQQTADGSAAVWAGDHFINFDDETNIARLFKAGTGSAPIKKWDLTSSLGLTKEADFEDAARISNDVLLITSHGRNKDGELKTDRYRFARLSVSGSGATTNLSVTGYTKNLLQNMLDSTKWQQPDTTIINLLKQRTQLETATVPSLAPKVDGFNIEGIAQLPGNTTRVAIGLRNPLINNQAIVITLENPLEAATGATPIFGQAIRLDLAGYGVRGMAWSAADNVMYILAGHINSDPEANFFLYRWDGLPTSAAEYLGAYQHSSGGSLEAILPHAGTKTLRILVDEGAVLINGTENKSSPTADQRFHDMLITLP